MSQKKGVMYLLSVLFELINTFASMLLFDSPSEMSTAWSLSGRIMDPKLIAKLKIPEKSGVYGNNLIMGPSL